MTKTAFMIRKEFVDFFVKKEHRFVPSSPVVPQDDPTLLFTNAGMNQFKAIFLGENKEGVRRAVNSQKCMRVSGKHNDLEEVGVDHHHHTFFEMLGNWSFGDYYKKEAIQWAWELLTQQWQLPKDVLHATVYKDDNEAMELWKQVTDIDHLHISKHGDKDNFWEMGETGPCGPCAEIHLDTGSCVNAHKKGHVCAVNAEACDRFIEIWNLVFIQYNREKDGTLTELPYKHVDTGMGFERIVRIIQKKKSNYDTDLFMPIIHHIETLCGKKYDKGPGGTPFRVIADHVRSLVFAITDGAFPSNEGRGYVIRRLLRRAYRFGRKLGFTAPFIYKLVPDVVEIMGDAFAEITQRREFVTDIIRSEEERFDQTLELGLEKINQLIQSHKQADEQVLSGTDVFVLYDTYGFPMDLTRLIASEQGLSIDEAGFEQQMLQQRSRSREAAKAGEDTGLTAHNWVELHPCQGTEFVGYQCDEVNVRTCRYKISVPGNSADSFVDALVVFDQTPFYAEMGGQAGDKGTLITENGTGISVTDTIKWNDMTIHKVHAEPPCTVAVFSGMLRARVDSAERLHTKRNHSATHLLHTALRTVLGDHISQSGSRVNPHGLRFDFTHFKALTQEEIEAVENQVNQLILQNLPIETSVKPVEEAKREGAIALFGEKYGETVRVVCMGAVSKELCGGTHVGSTGQIGLFRIVSESSIAAGVRRIEAVTGMESLYYFRKKEAVLHTLLSVLKVNEDNAVQRAQDVLDKIKNLELELAALSHAAVQQTVHQILDDAGRQSKGPLRWIVKNLNTVDKQTFTAIVNSISDKLKEPSHEQAVVFCSGIVENRILFTASAGKTAVKKYGIHCGELVKAAASRADGGGGGSPSRAQAGGKNVEKINEALEVARTYLENKAGAV